MRTAGDMVARMQLNHKMKIKEAKEYVAGKLGVTPKELSDPIVMNTLREDLKLGGIAQFAGQYKGLEAKFRIAEVLGIKINSVERFKDKVGMSIPSPVSK